MLMSSSFLIKNFKSLNSTNTNLFLFNAEFHFNLLKILFEEVSITEVFNLFLI